MKILVYEHFSGGARGVSPSANLLALGRAMLRACIEDAIAAGHDVCTVAGERVAPDLPDKCRIIRSGSSDWLAGFEQALTVVDAVLPIAPESDGILQKLSVLVERSGKLLLGSSSAAIAVAGDKLTATAAVSEHGCITPATARWPLDDRKFRGKRPWILKPRRGAGCAGIYKTDCPETIELPREEYIVQEFIAGTPASVAMIVGKCNHVVLSVNSQSISFDPAPRYNGGTIPLEHPLSGRAIACANGIVEAIPGLRGYVGVDMVLTEDTVYIIEVNPRITFTYCGLRRIVSENLLHTIINAALGSVLHPILLNGSVEFDGTGRIFEESAAEALTERVR